MARRRLGVGRQGQGVVVGVVITRGQREGLACQQQADDGRQDGVGDARHRSLEETGCGDLPQGATG